MEDWYSLDFAREYLKLEKIEFREYQLNIVKSIIEHGNTLVVLPTGLGKTIIGLCVIAYSLYNNKKALFLAPTKPLAEQHYQSIIDLMKIDPSKVLLLTGSTSKKLRELENIASIVVATPQTIMNDLKNNKISLDGFGAIIFDECHRAVGKYAYTYVANEAKLKDILIVGLTASPGSKKERIREIIDLLGIKHIEARTSISDDVLPYIKPKTMKTIIIELTPTIREVDNLIKPIGQESLKELNDMGIINYKKFENIPKKELLEIGDEISKIEGNIKFKAFQEYSKLLNIVHMHDLLTTEGISPFLDYIDSLESRENKSRGLYSLLKDPRFIFARRKAKEAKERGEEHPKVHALIDILKDYRDSKSIVFAQYRSTIKMINEYLSNNNFLARPFVGKREGITQEAQKETINDFRLGKFNILLATSIGEEGLDIPSVDLVIFYEPIPSEIRNIQRKGRTGRFRAGFIYILITKDTKDEIYFFVSLNREKRMLRLINELNRELELGQRRLY